MPTNSSLEPPLVVGSALDSELRHSTVTGCFVSSGGEELYDQGYALFHQQRYPESERAFRLFLSRYANSDLADNALFWIGESRWARGDFAAALESYTTMVEQYPGRQQGTRRVAQGGSLPGERSARPLRAVRTFEEVVLRFAGLRGGDYRSGAPGRTQVARLAGRA